MTPTSDELLSAEHAATFLNVSERRLRDLVAQGKLRREKGPRAPGQFAAPALYYRSDLEAIKRGEPNHYPASNDAAADGTGAAVAIAPKVPKVLNSDSVLPAMPQLGALVERVLALLPAAAPHPAPLPWVSVEEAAAASGLSVARIRILAPRWAALGMAVRGARPRRADGSFESCSGWKILRAALDSPLPPESV